MNILKQYSRCHYVTDECTRHMCVHNCDCGIQNTLSMSVCVMKTSNGSSIIVLNNLCNSSGCIILCSVTN